MIIDTHGRSISVKAPADVRVFANANAVAAAAASMMVEESQRETERVAAVSIALAGGSTPKACYGILSSDPALKAAMPWGKTHWFFGDERHVPPDSPESNYRMAKESLFDPARVPETQVKRVPAELPDAAEAASRYDQEIARFRALQSNGGPAHGFNIMLLGMGDDGHTASLFPDTEALGETSRSFTSVWVSKLNSQRLTVTPPELIAAHKVIVLITGESKAARLAGVLNGPVDTSKTPIQLLFGRSTPAIWLVDEAAAAGL